MTNHRTILLKFFIALLLATVISGQWSGCMSWKKVLTHGLPHCILALPADSGMLQNTGSQLGCTEGCNNYSEVVSHHILSFLFAWPHLPRSWRPPVTTGLDTALTRAVLCLLPPAWDSWRCSSGRCSVCGKPPSRVMECWNCSH